MGEIDKDNEGRRLSSINDLDLKLKEMELAIKKEKLAKVQKDKNSRWRNVNPLIIGIVAALLGFLGNVMVTYMQGQHALKLEMDKFKSSLIMEAIKTDKGDDEEAGKKNAKKNLEFFLEAGLLEDEDGKIARYIETAIPTLPVGQVGYSKKFWIEAEVRKKLFGIIAYHVGIDEHKIRLDVSLTSDLNASEDNIKDIIIELNQEFGVSITVDVLGEDYRVNELMDHLVRRLSIIF